MDQKYIMQLAVEELQRRKAKIEAEIEAIHAEIGKSKSVRTAVKAKAVAPGAGRRRERSESERKAQSEKMKKVWAARRAAKK
jgi:hypothetical protein